MQNHHTTQINEVSHVCVIIKIQHPCMIQTANWEQEEISSTEKGNYQNLCGQACSQALSLPWTQ